MEKMGTLRSRVDLKAYVLLNHCNCTSQQASQRDDDCIVFIVGCKADLKEKACISTQQATQKATVRCLSVFYNLASICKFISRH